MINYNIDRVDARQISKAPFTYESTMELGGSELPAGSFISLRVYAEDMSRVPFRFHSLMQDGRVAICDADGNIVAYWHTFQTTKGTVDKNKYISSLLVNTNGVIAGHIGCTQTAMAIIRSVIANNSDTVFLPADAFVFLPQCHVSMISGSGRVFNVQKIDGSIGQYTANMTLTAAPVEDEKEQMVIISVTPGEDFNVTHVDLINTETAITKRLVANGICTVKVDGETVWEHTQNEGKNTNIIIKSGVLSNLRVSKSANTLTLTGVNNA